MKRGLIPVGLVVAALLLSVSLVGPFEAAAEPAGEFDWVDRYVNVVDTEDFPGWVSCDDPSEEGPCARWNTNEHGPGTAIKMEILVCYQDGERLVPGGAETGLPVGIHEVTGATIRSCTTPTPTSTPTSTPTDTPTPTSTPTDTPTPTSTPTSTPTDTPTPEPTDTPLPPPVYATCHIEVDMVGGLSYTVGVTVVYTDALPGGTHGIWFHVPYPGDPPERTWVGESGNGVGGPWWLTYLYEDGRSQTLAAEVEGWGGHRGRCATVFELPARVLLPLVVVGYPHRIPNPPQSCPGVGWLASNVGGQAENWTRLDELGCGFSFHSGRPLSLGIPWGAYLNGWDRIAHENFRYDGPIGTPARITEATLWFVEFGSPVAVVTPEE